MCPGRLEFGIHHVERVSRECGRLSELQRRNVVRSQRRHAIAQQTAVLSKRVIGDRAWIANPFVARLGRSGLKVETVVLDERSTEKDVQNAIERARSADLVLASLYGRVRSGQASSVGIPDSGARALLTLLAEKKPVVGISFGNPYLLQSFPGLRAYMVAYGDMPSLQNAVARALMGEIDITGRLPISLPGLYPRGTGIQVKR